jgi:hypothetical protein
MFLCCHVSFIRLIYNAVLTVWNDCIPFNCLLLKIRPMFHIKLSAVFLFLGVSFLGLITADDCTALP